MEGAVHHDPAGHEPTPSALLLVAGRLWDGTGAGARRDRALLIRDGRVGGKNAYELELMVERGLSPEQALLTATRNAAEALGAGDRLGTLEPGKLADLLVVDGEPDRDVRLLQDPARLLVVMQQGRIVVDRRKPAGGGA